MFSLRCKCLLLNFVLWAHTPAVAQTSDDFFNPTVVNDIRIELHPLDWSALSAHPESNQYYSSNIHWRGVTVENAQIRSRGGGSRNHIKPGFKVDIDKSRPGRDFLGLTAFILDNGAQDASLMKEALSMRLFERMKLPAPRETHVRLFVNNEYFGLYILVEEIDEAFLNRHFGERAGYLYEYRWVFPYHFEYLGADPKLYSPVLFEPETHKDDPEPRPLEAMIRAIDPTLTPDSIFSTAVASYIDMPSLLRYLAVESYVAEWDGLLGHFGLNNFYLYRSVAGISRFIPWDKDTSFGGYIATADDRIRYPILENAPENILIRRALGVAEWRILYLEALSECERIAGGAGGWLESEALRMRGLIQAAALEDPRKVCPDELGSLKLCSNEAFEAEGNFVLEFIRQRGAWVKESLEAAWTLHNKDGSP